MNKDETLKLGEEKIDEINNNIWKKLNELDYSSDKECLSLQGGLKINT